MNFKRQVLLPAEHFKVYHQDGSVTHLGRSAFSRAALGPVHTGRGAPRNRHTQILEHIMINGIVHTGCKQHQKLCTQICLRVLCERGLKTRGNTLGEQGGTDPFLSSASTSSTVMPKMKIFSGPISSRISTFAPSRVPIVSAPFNCNAQSDCALTPET